MLTNQTRWSLGHGKPPVRSRWQATSTRRDGPCRDRQALPLPGPTDPLAPQQRRAGVSEVWPVSLAKAQTTGRGVPGPFAAASRRSRA
jgi:hypothetical protein